VVGRLRGFTLIELVVCVALVALLTSLAVPAYRQYVRRAARADATAALLRIAANQERYYLQNNSYASNDELAPAPPAGLGFGGTERGFYALSLEAAAGGLQQGYTATATVIVGEDQEDDEDCWIFTINEQGLRSAATRSDTDNSQRCWR
jgi:type IV pilus assembly protein PilE